MRKLIFVVLVVLLSFLSAYGERLELDDGRFVDEYGEIHDTKFENEDYDAPWNDSSLQDDPYAPWNDSMYQDDPFAPWNDPYASESDTNIYLREQGETGSEYYWD